jgi:hypothetical protein
MKNLTHTLLELEDWCSDGSVCDFCFGLNKASYQIKTRSQITNKILANDFICENCKVRFENDELSKCSRCGRLRIQSDIEYLTNKVVCRCVKRNENPEEKELPNLPHERESMSAFYERQINSLQEQLTETEEALEIEREEVVKFQEKSEEWGKRQKQELLDRIKQLEAENGNYKEEVKRLKTQLEQLTSQHTAQIEVKENKRWPWLKLRK